jgi:hypothetical protein
VAEAAGAEAAALIDDMADDEVARCLKRAAMPLAAREVRVLASADHYELARALLVVSGAPNRLGRGAGDASPARAITARRYSDRSRSHPDNLAVCVAFAQWPPRIGGASTPSMSRDHEERRPHPLSRRSRWRALRPAWCGGGITLSRSDHRGPCATPQPGARIAAVETRGERWR